MLETEINKKTERWAGLELGKRWDCQVFEMPKYYRIDWQLMKDDKTIGFAEFKARSYTFSQLEELGGCKIDLSKYLAIDELSERTNLPVFLVIKCALDDLYVYRHKRPEFMEYKFPEITRFGKSYRNLKNDAEPAVVFPMNLFQKVNGPENG